MLPVLFVRIEKRQNIYIDETARYGSHTRRMRVCECIYLYVYVGYVSVCSVCL